MLLLRPSPPPPRSLLQHAGRLWLDLELLEVGLLHVDFPLEAHPYQQRQQQQQQQCRAAGVINNHSLGGGGSCSIRS